MNHRSTSRRAVACVTTGALAVVASGALASPAHAATADDVRYSSSTGTAVVGLSIAVPDALAPVLSAAGLPNPIELTLLGTNATDTHGADSSKDVATATSSLAGGSLITSSPLSTLLAPLNSVLTSDLKSPGPKTANTITVPSNPLGLLATIGGQNANVTPSSRYATSGGRVADLTLGSLADLGLAGTLGTAFDTLNTALTTLTTSIAPVTSALGALPALPSVSIPNPLAGIIPGAPATISTPPLAAGTVSTTLNALPALLTGLEDKLLNGSIVDLKGIGSLQSITPATNSVTAKGSSSVGTINLFGGLVSVVASDANVTAIAARTKSAATSTASATLLSVKIADSLQTLLTTIASDQGIITTLLPGTPLGDALDPTLKPVVQTVSSSLDTVLAQVTGLLSTLNSGVKLIQQGTTSKKVSADGRSAEAHATPASVTLGLPIAPNLVTLTVGRADAVSSLSVAAPVVVPPTVALPRTGGSEDAAALAALLLVAAGGAVVLRRRASSTV